MKISTLRTLSLLAFATAALSASAAPLVSYTVSGSAGAYVLDFSVTNTLGGTNQIYFFGVQPPTRTGDPLGWDDRGGYSTAFDGGSGRVYASSWIDLNATQTNVGPNAIQPGDTLSGFQITVASLPTSGINWFAYAFGGTYAGGDNFKNQRNPGFEGRAFEAGASAVPGPAAALPFALMALRRRRKA